MKFKKVMIAGMSVLLSIGFLTGCSPKSSTTKSSSTAKSAKVKLKVKEMIRIAERDEIPTMDSVHSVGPVATQNLTNTMDGLYRYETTTLKPAMAEKIVKPTNKGLTYTFKIRKNARWSNGEAVTSSDFVGAWRKAVDPEAKSQNAYLYNGIKNAAEITAGKKPVTSLGIKALNQRTLQVTLEKPLPYFNQLLACVPFYPQNQKMVKKWGNQYGTSSKTILFNGPYVLNSWNGSDNTWTEQKNNRYWNAKNVKTDKIQYQVVKDPTTSLNLYQNNNLDRVMISGSLIRQMKDSPDFELAKKNATYYLTPNLKKVPLLKNTKIRQALSLSINRKQLVDKVLGGGSGLTYSFTPKGMSFDPKNPSKDFASETSSSAAKYGKYNPTKAKKLWQEGLKETGNQGKTINIELLADDMGMFKAQSEFLQNQLEQLQGLKITLRNVPTKSRMMRQNSGDFDIVAAPTAADFPDPINFLDLLTTNSSFNYGKWSNSKYDALVKKSSSEDANNPTARWKDLLAAQDLLNEEQPVISLFQPAGAWLTKKGMTGFTLSPNSVYDMASVEASK